MFIHVFANAQGCTDLESLCIEYQSNRENKNEIIKIIYSVITTKSIKNY